MSGLARKLLIFPPIALGVAALALAAAQRAAPQRAGAAEIATVVRFVQAAPQPVTPRVVGYGEVAPARTWSAASQVDGRVVHVSEHFVEGGLVKAGETVIRIAPEEYRLAVVQAEAEIASVKAQIQEKRLSEESTRVSLQIERDSLALAQRDLQRQQDLVGRGAASSAAADAQERAVLTQKGAVQNLENQLRLIPAQLDALEQSLAVQTARLENARLDLARTEIDAPFEGRVASSSVEIGQYVGVGGALGSVDGVAKAEIEARIATPKMRDFARIMTRARPDGAPLPSNISERIIMARQARGLRAVARLAFQDQPAEWPAAVERVSDTVDPATRAVGLIVSVDDPYGQSGQQSGEPRPPLIKGMFVEVELRADPVEGLTPVPRAALTDGAALLAGPDDRLARRAVTVAGTLGDVALVSEGLKPGDRVIVSAISPAVEGMLLQPVRDEAAEARLTATAQGAGAPR